VVLPRIDAALASLPKPAASRPSPEGAAGVGGRRAASEECSPP
jgi:hypothetical protein